MTPAWPTVTVHFSAPASLDGWDHALALLMSEHDCLGSEEPEPGPDGFPTLARLTFPQETPVEDARRAVEATLSECLPGAAIRIEAALVPEQDWVAAWREHYHAVPVTPTLSVGPPEEAPEALPPGGLYIRIEPGAAFGTGTHPTTRGVLAMLEAAMRAPAATRPRVVLDVGAGSGVLSIAAVLMGAQRAIALEKDLVAEENFRHNAALNGVADRLELIRGGEIARVREALESQGETRMPDLVLCNMIRTEFEPLLGDLRVLGAPMLLSGFLREEEEEVRRLLAGVGWEVAEETWLEDWGTFGVLPL